jgi:hypothetical protein
MERIAREVGGRVSVSGRQEIAITVGLDCISCGEAFGITGLIPTLFPQLGAQISRP